MHTSTAAALLLLLVVLTAQHPVRAQSGSPNAYLVLCAGSSNAAPFSSIVTTFNALTGVCGVLNSGGDIAFRDLQASQPAALGMAGYTAGFSNSMASSRVGTGAGSAKASIAAFNVQLVAGQPMPPEVLTAVATGLMYPSAFLITARKADLSTSSVWALRNVAISNATTEWVTTGPTHRLTLLAGTASYKVYTATPGTQDLSKYGKVACFNAERNTASSSTDAC